MLRLPGTHENERLQAPWDGSHGDAKTAFQKVIKETLDGFDAIPARSSS